MFADHPTLPEVTPLYYATVWILWHCRTDCHTCPSDVNARGGYYITPLHAAIARVTWTLLAQVLLEHHADVTASDDNNLEFRTLRRTQGRRVARPPTHCRVLATCVSREDLEVPLERLVGTNLPRFSERVWHGPGQRQARGKCSAWCFVHTLGSFEGREAGAKAAVS